MSQKKYVEGDRFAIGRFALRTGGFLVCESGNELTEVLAHIPQHLDSNENERLSVVEVLRWVEGCDSSTSEPDDLVTLYEVEHYEDPIEIN